LIKTEDVCHPSLRVLVLSNIEGDGRAFVLISDDS
jgi:hypothetical protein